jgi:hypothetical protein
METILRISIAHRESVRIYTSFDFMFKVFILNNYIISLYNLNFEHHRICVTHPATSVPLHLVFDH